MFPFMFWLVCYGCLNHPAIMAAIMAILFMHLTDIVIMCCITEIAKKMQKIGCGTLFAV